MSFALSNRTFQEISSYLVNVESPMLKTSRHIHFGVFNVSVLLSSFNFEAIGNRKHLKQKTSVFFVSKNEIYA